MNKLLEFKVRTRNKIAQKRLRRVLKDVEEKHGVVYEMKEYE